MKRQTISRHLFKTAVRRLAHLFSLRPGVTKRRRNHDYERQYAVLRSVMSLPVACGILGMCATAAHASAFGQSTDPAWLSASRCSVSAAASASPGSVPPSGDLIR